MNITNKIDNLDHFYFLLFGRTCIVKSSICKKSNVDIGIACENFNYQHTLVYKLNTNCQRVRLVAETLMFPAHSQKKLITREKYVDGNKLMISRTTRANLNPSAKANG